MNEQRPASPFARIATGIAGLDRVLRGGLLTRSIYILSGQPGAGKTIMANQISFQHAANGGRVLFVTLLAETHDQMVDHLRDLEFFDQSVITHELYYISGFETMEREGLGGLIRMLVGEIRARAISLVVIDGLASVWSASDSEISFKRFIHDLSVVLRLSDCTALLLTQKDDVHFRAEHTMVDGLIELSDELFDVRAERYLTVSKFRGSGYLRGQHLFTISDSGVSVYPRTEALYTAPAVVEGRRRERMGFGVEGLDRALYGGLWSASATAIVGVPGSGKTLLGLHFLAAGAREDQPGLYFGFYEERSRLIDKANQVGLDFTSHVEHGLVHIFWETALEQPLDMLASRLLDLVEQRGIRRLVIDGMNSFQQAAVYPERLGRFYAALFGELRSRDVTVLFTVETPHLFGDPIDWPIRGVTSLSENMIFLRYIDVDAKLVRLISILKVRDSAYDTTIRTLTIDEHGLAVNGPFPTLRTEDSPRRSRRVPPDPSSRSSPDEGT